MKSLHSNVLHLPAFPDGTRRTVVVHFKLNFARIALQQRGVEDATLLPPGSRLVGWDLDPEQEDPDGGPMGYPVLPPRSRAFTIPRNALGLILGSDPRWSEPSVIEITSVVEKLEAIFMIGIFDDVSVQLASPGSPCLDLGNLFQKDAPASEDLSPAEYLAETSKYLETPGTPTEKTKYRSFFFDMDRRSEESLGSIYDPADPSDFYTWSVFSVSFTKTKTALQLRLEHRIAEETSAPNSYSVYPGLIARYDALDNVSKFLVGLMKKHFPGNEPQRLAQLEDAFEMFANGELRFQLPSPHFAWTTQPSSTYYFLFAEIAFACVELKVTHSAFWKKLLNALVRTQRIYTDVYGIDDATLELPMGGFSGCSFHEERMWTWEQKTALRQEFANKPFDELVVIGAEQAAAAIAI